MQPSKKLNYGIYYFISQVIRMHGEKSTIQFTYTDSILEADRDVKIEEGVYPENLSIFIYL